MSFKQFIAKSFADAEKAQQRKKMLQGRKLAKSSVRKALSSAKKNFNQKGKASH
jgi:hypothetical protein